MKPFIRPQFLHLLGFFVCFHVPLSPGISTTSAGSGDGTPSTATVKGRTSYNSGLPCHNIPRPWPICCSRVPSSPPPSNPLRRRLFGVLETRAMPTNHCIVTEECGVFVSTFHEKSPRIWSNFEQETLGPHHPVEVHLPYLLHFLDSFGLGGMRDLVVAPEHLALRNANNGSFRAPAETLETFPYHLKWQIPGAA